MSNRTLSIDDRTYDYLCNVAVNEPELLTQLREDRFLRESLRRRFGDAEVNHLDHWLAVVERDHDVRRLQVSVVDPLLMGVTEGVRKLDS